MGAGNTSVLMQLLLGMLDASLARQQDLVPAQQRVAVALKIDEAPLVLNRGFAETMALKRSAGLETVACWQTDAQWVDREVRDQLDALFAHRVYFATASARDARAGAALTMAEFSDTVRPGLASLSALGHPDVRLHLPKHHAIVSWSTPAGRQPPFIAAHRPAQRRWRARGIARRAPAPSAAAARAWICASRTGIGGSQACEPIAARRCGRRRRARAGHRSRARRRGSSPRSPAASRRGRPSTASRRVTADARGSGGELSRARGARRRTQRALGQGDRAGPSAATRATRHRDPRAARAPGTSALKPDPPPLQSRRARPPPRSEGSSACPTPAWSQRFQFHRPHGGGVPMCYAPHSRRRAAAAHRRSPRRRRSTLTAARGAARGPAPATRAELRRARRDIHIAGWVLALERSLDGHHATLRGARGIGALAAPSRKRATGPSRSGPPICASQAGGRRTTSCARTPTAARSRWSASRPCARARASSLRTTFAGRLRRRAAPTARRVARHGRCDGRAGRPHRRPGGPRASSSAMTTFWRVGRVHTRRYGRRGEAVGSGRVRLSRQAASTRLRLRGRPTAESVPRLRRRVSLRLAVPRSRAHPVRVRAGHPRGPSARLRCPSPAPGGARRGRARRPARRRGPGRVA